MCGECMDKLRELKCPECRTDLPGPEGRIRSLALEREIGRSGIVVDCPDCDEKVPYTEFVTHKKACKIGPFACPFETLDPTTTTTDPILQCRFRRMSLAAWLEHVQTVHFGITNDNVRIFVNNRGRAAPTYEEWTRMTEAPDDSAPWSVRERYSRYRAEFETPTLQASCLMPLRQNRNSYNGFEFDRSPYKDVYGDKSTLYGMHHGMLFLLKNEHVPFQPVLIRFFFEYTTHRALAFTATAMWTPEFKESMRPTVGTAEEPKLIVQLVQTTQGIAKDQTTEHKSIPWSQFAMPEYGTPIVHRLTSYRFLSEDDPTLAYNDTYSKSLTFKFSTEPFP